MFSRSVIQLCLKAPSAGPLTAGLLCVSEAGSSLPMRQPPLIPSSHLTLLCSFISSFFYLPLSFQPVPSLPFSPSSLPLFILPLALPHYFTVFLLFSLSHSSSNDQPFSLLFHLSSTLTCNSSPCFLHFAHHTFLLASHASLCPIFHLSALHLNDIKDNE